MRSGTDAGPFFLRQLNAPKPWIKPGINSFMISIDLEPQFDRAAIDNQLMNEEIKLIAAFLALNAGVIALAVAGYAKGGMDISAVIQHLNQ